MITVIYRSIRLLLLDITLISVLLLYILRSNLNKSFNVMGDLNRWTRWHYSWVVFDAKYNWWDEKCVSGVTTIYQTFSTILFYVLFNGVFERLNWISFLCACFLAKYDIQFSNTVTICYGISNIRKSSKIPTTWKHLQRQDLII